jgi:hypothetical protein
MFCRGGVRGTVFSLDDFHTALAHNVGDGTPPSALFSSFRRIKVNIEPDGHMPVGQHTGRRSGEAKPTILRLKEQPAEEVNVAEPRSVCPTR